MKTINIEIPDSVHKRLKVYCASKSVSMKQFIITHIEYIINKKIGGTK